MKKIKFVVDIMLALAFVITAEKVLLENPDNVTRIFMDAISLYCGYGMMRMCYYGAKRIHEDRQ